MGLSVTKLLLILLIVLLVFGAGRLTKVMGDVGKGIRALREGLKDEHDDPQPPIEQRQIKAEMQVPVSEREKEKQE